MAAALKDRRRARRKSEELKEWPDQQKYNPRSLRLFTLTSPFRRWCIRAIEWKWWDRSVLALIFLNTIQLAMFDPFDTDELRPDPTQRNAMDIIGKVGGESHSRLKFFHLESRALGSTGPWIFWGFRV